MSKSRRNQPALTRRSTQSLDHTVSSRQRRDEPSTVRALMRTVLGDTTRPARPARVVSFPKLKPSPGPVVRASGRSLSLQTKAASPWLQATFYKPEVSQRAFDCARRAIRREVLFAIGKRRKGSGGSRSKQSKTRC